jgi:exodeoxyribonuclease VII small subunit
MATQPSFEDNLAALEAIVKQLESGDIPLEDAIKTFQDGMKLSTQLQKSLKAAEDTLVKVMKADGTEGDFDDTTL